MSGMNMFDKETGEQLPYKKVREIAAASMSPRPAGYVRAEVGVDQQHGPTVRVEVGDTVVTIYLMDETGGVLTDAGRCGIEVSGPWHLFRDAVALLKRT